MKYLLRSQDSIQMSLWTLAGRKGLLNPIYIWCQLILNRLRGILPRQVSWNNWFGAIFCQLHTSQNKKSHMQTIARKLICGFKNEWAFCAFKRKKLICAFKQKWASRKTHLRFLRLNSVFMPVFQVEVCTKLSHVLLVISTFLSR